MEQKKYIPPKRKSNVYTPQKKQTRQYIKKKVCVVVEYKKHQTNNTINRERLRSGDVAGESVLFFMKDDIKYQEQTIKGQLHKETDAKMSNNTTQEKLSTYDKYYPSDVKDSIKSLLSRSNKTFVGPCYNNSDNKNIIVDIQPIVTGTIENNETSSIAAAREVGEEIGLPLISLTYKTTHTRRNKYTRNNEIFVIYVATVTNKR